MASSNFGPKVGQHTTRAIHAGKERILEQKDFHISPDIQRKDFDWEESRPLNPWAVRREIFNLPGLWNVDWIEVFSADVTKLCTSRSQGEATQTAFADGRNT